MLASINISNILFLDIETVPKWEKYSLVPTDFRKLWDQKATKLNTTQSSEEIYDRAGIYAEFGKIICISVAYVSNGTMKVKSFFGHDEKQLLLEFAEMLNTYYNKDNSLLCAHNGKEFDFPYLGRRMVVNGVELPTLLDISGKKPWEVKLLDTMDLWRFGDYKSYTSLALLCALFEIPTPKNDISGADVCRVYWQDKDLNRIMVYCQKDVITIVQLFLKYQNKPMIAEDMIFYS
ncbi:MAG: 3'-5' exonuclease [Bacteroidota bacterium]